MSVQVQTDSGFSAERPRRPGASWFSRTICIGQAIRYEPAPSTIGQGSRRLRCLMTNHPLSVVPKPESELAKVYLYHDRTKHRLNRYARSLGYLDWANQPHPFRRFDGARLIPLPVPEIKAEPTYDSTLSAAVPPARVDIETISNLFFFSLALSAWK